ncbi:MAG: S41 family peptidase [Pseudohongiellaceae bacterium]
MSFIRPFYLCIAAFLFAISTAATATEGYYRWPSAQGGTLVFTAEGDLWRLDESSPQAIRLTTHDELESNAAISPDGEQVAFVASFDGLAQLYVMPLAGGIPRQITFESVGVQLSEWAPDGRLLYTSRNMEGPSRVRELRLVDPNSLAVERVPLRYASTGTFGDDGDSLFFTRHGVSTVSDNARLYRGGGMSQLWRFEMGSNNEATRLAADFEGPIESPMFFNDRIYFISDESGFDNIWSMRPNGNDIRQHSNFTGWRLRGASMNNGTIHFQRGADIFSFDLSTNEEAQIEISLASDKDRTRLRWINDPLTYLNDSNLGSSNNRVAITARGRVMIGGTDEQRRVELPVGHSNRARSAIPGVDGKWIYAIVDDNERGEIWRFAADGSGSGEQLTFDADDHRWRIALSPDGKWLIHDDKSSRRWKLNLETMENTLVMQRYSTQDDFYGPSSFSPDGRYMAFHAAGNGDNSQVIQVHDLLNDETTEVSSQKYLSFDPAFSRDGDWLYFLSARNFRPTPGAPWGDRNMGAQFDKRAQIFALKLTDDAVFPFAKPNELSPNVDAGAMAEGEDAEATADTAANEIAKTVNWQRVSQRLFKLPIEAGNYSSLQAAENRLFVIGNNERASALKSFPLTHDDPTVSTFTGNVREFQISSDGEKLFFRTRGRSPTLAVVPVGEKAPDDLTGHRVRTEGWRLAIEPSNEWQQLFLDAWRLHRDFAYDETMRGTDWTAVRDRLLPLASRIGHRSDLNDLLGQMSSEIGILHSQIRAGDQPEDAESASVASLGARYALHEEGVEIIQIYQGEQERPETLGPLSQPEDDFAVGDVITAINNRPVLSSRDLERALLNSVGEQTLISTLRNAESIQNVVTPISTNAESMLRYLDWTGATANKVAFASEGEIGYLHLRAMGGGDVASFARDFFPQTHLDGLIVDVRDNSGGNVDSWIIQQFLREVWAFWQSEPNAPTFGNMQNTFRGHLAVLINAGTYSDGETFAAGIKALDLGVLIGERTAGAGIWLSDRNSLADGGMSRVAELAQYGLDGRWLIEGQGISPDIEVVGEPHALFTGEDQQLMAAIDYLKEKMRSEPIPELIPQPLPPLGERGSDVRD